MEKDKQIETKAEFKAAVEELQGAIETKLSDAKEAIEAKADAKALDALQAELVELKSKHQDLVRAQVEIKVDNQNGETKSEGDKRVEELFRTNFKGHDMSTEELEVKTIYIGDDSNAGYLVRPQVEQTISTVAKERSPFASRVETIVINTDHMERVDNSTELNLANAYWGSELDAGTTEQNLSLKMQKIYAHDLYVSAYFSGNMLADAPEVESMVGEEVGYLCAEKRADAYFNGDGAGKPRGFLSTESLAKIEQISSGAAAGLTLDGLIDLETALKDNYREGAVFMMNRKTWGEVKKLEDAEETKYIMPDVVRGTGYTLMGYPVVLDENMPDVAANAYPIFFGDLMRFYTVVERQGLMILDDPYTARPRNAKHYNLRVGGDLKIAEAGKLLKVEA